MPEQFTVNAKNNRCINGTTTAREGFATLSNDMDLSPNVVRNVSSNDELYTVIDQKLWQVDVDTGDLTHVGSSSFANDVKMYDVVF